MSDALVDDIDLDRNPWPRAADYIDEHGWTKGAEVTPDGKVCIQGAVRLCSPVPGDGAIHRAILIERGKGANLNDASETTVDDVRRYLRVEAGIITDEELELTFGPDWRHVVAMVRHVATWDQARLEDWWRLIDKVWVDDASGYRAAYYRAVDGVSGPGIAARRALVAVVAVVGVALVAAALARRHEIGTPGGPTQEDYDTVGRPWVEFTGQPVHPDDAPAVAA